MQKLNLMQNRSNLTLQTKLPKFTELTPCYLIHIQSLISLKLGTNGGRNKMYFIELFSFLEKNFELKGGRGGERAQYSG